MTVSTYNISISTHPAPANQPISTASPIIVYTSFFDGDGDKAAPPQAPVSFSRAKEAPVFAKTAAAPWAVNFTHQAHTLAYFTRRHQVPTYAPFLPLREARQSLLCCFLGLSSLPRRFTSAKMSYPSGPRPLERMSQLWAALANRYLCRVLRQVVALHILRHGVGQTEIGSYALFAG
ncbi:hypothetical protein BOTBODRAFT_174338 [Botryobasidium botryosum FD-172 SS1]|uniref:Uncharacterized protein n=1 Tax=Botryobasidium botryosum (strain FD-172 SS1) TaxID=930990 RepID=A0A067MH19_BOTB1|nr:hypothetical protein BOTBODRAFT_174338 [Botryobasidium botryosum FD-172 SS1]